MPMQLNHIGGNFRGVKFLADLVETDFVGLHFHGWPQI